MTTTKGKYRVGTTFNPSGNDVVDEIKARAADLIDFIENEIDVPPHETPNETRQSAEIARLKALAQTEIESAAMWAVKAATKRKPGE
ncbi:Acb2/Tad1 domain-containing protein [Roseovarius nitratireducens]|uniref:Acb2/Tad1 domain-containing protein n=1 Tax=Roseovarius nitratireducens TaxID=2044597 RepID=UPI000CE1C9E8|nr:hypothetical protein [Roseovarius nitratireducens]